MTPLAATQDPTTPLWWGAVVLRVFTLLFAGAVLVQHYDGYARPTLGAVVIALMIGWTALCSYVYLNESARWLTFTVLDLALCCVFMTASRWVLTDAQLTGPATPLVPTIWVAGAVAAGAVRGGPVVGTIFGVVVAGFNYGVRGFVDTDLTRDAVLLIGAGYVLGLAANNSRKAAERLARALRAEAATAERERLARSIHDGVLQVLARVRSRGAALGGEAAELAELAGAQEVALRALVTAGPPESTADGTADLSARLRVLATDRVQVATPATAVPLAEAAVAELVFLVREALQNVRRHAGPLAKAWVLVEDLGTEVVVSVRDDGPGIPAGRIEAADAEGRLGIARSIKGRVGELGGTIALDTAPDAGTEWEVRVPR
ncbi:MAG: MacS family sensor histidine kinase [Labedaea sp.]